MVTCFNSADGMGLCLRGKMTDAGLLPAPASAAATPSEAVAVAAPADMAVGTPEVAVTPEAALPENLIAATFGLLRAEPDGSVVIAGSGTPGTEVEVYSNGDLLGRTTVEPSGDWVLVPDQPIPPGGTELTLAEAGKDGRAAQSFVVVINEDKTSEPLVVASTPGAASEILQGLPRPPPGASVAVAAANPAAAPTAPVAPATAPTAPAVAETAPAPSPAAPAAAPTEQPAVAATETPATAPPADNTPEVAATPAAPANEAMPAAVAAAEPAVPTPAAGPAPAYTGAAPTIDAIEIEGSRTFFAGSGAERATIRLYIDDTFIADALVSDGRWLVEAGNVLTKPSQRIRIDMLQSGTADVAARAEVDFVVDLPAGAPTAVAAAEPAPATPVAPAPAAPAASTVAPTAPAASQPVASGRDTATPATPAVPAAPAAVAAAPDAAQAAPSATDAPVSDVPTMVATAAGDPEAQRFVSGKAIIRRGDNLWTIARRVYGQGIKYTAIYDANDDQIRDPDKIYPGQVFALPTNAD